MQGDPIEHLSEAMTRLPIDLRADSLARRRIDLAVVTFGPVRTAVPFTLANDFTPPKLVAHGSTPLGAAVRHGLRLVAARTSEYKAQHLEYFRPLVFLLTDGAPDDDDDWTSAAAASRQAEVDRHVSMFPVGVQGADMGVLRQFSSRRQPAHLKDLRFREFFVWLSNTLGAVAKSDPSPTASTPPPAAPSTGAWNDLFA